MAVIERKVLMYSRECTKTDTGILTSRRTDLSLEGGFRHLPVVQEVCKGTRHSTVLEAGRLREEVCGFHSKTPLYSQPCRELRLTLPSSR